MVAKARKGIKAKSELPIEATGVTTPAVTNDALAGGPPVTGALPVMPPVAGVALNDPNAPQVAKVPITVTLATPVELAVNKPMESPALSVLGLTPVLGVPIVTEPDKYVDGPVELTFKVDADLYDFLVRYGKHVGAGDNPSQVAANMILTVYQIATRLPFPLAVDDSFDVTPPDCEDYDDYCEVSEGE